MASILYAWEFGANLGHVGAFMPLARALRDAGHDLHWAVTQPGQVGAFLAGEGFDWLPAPVLAEQARPGPPLSYADILLRFGYADSTALYGLTGAWRRLIQLTGARLVMADHAPTAVLAARTLRLPVMLFSNGFTLPPCKYPTPNMRPWISIAQEQLEAIDNVACTTINAVLERFGSMPLNFTAQLFDVAEETMITFPELDHYPDRGPARYWGSLPSAGTGQNANWPEVAGSRIFAYLRHETTHHAAVLDALQRLGMPTLVFFPGVDPALRVAYRSPHLTFLEQPANIEQMAREADCAITYSSLATTTAFLLAGKPILLLPGHLEQFMLARRVEDMGAGRLINPEQPPGDLVTMIVDLLSNPSWRDNARAFAAKYAAFDQNAVTGNLVRRVTELIN